jgi:hypothetical protein
MVSHDGMSRKAKNNKRKSTMNKLHIHYRTIIPVVLMALTLACLPWQTGQGAGRGGGGASGGSIVGLWEVTYTSNAGNPLSPFQTYQQWYSDGMDIESPSFSPGECMGVWKQMASNMVQLYHVGWTIGNPPGTVRFVLTETISVSLDGNSFNGTYNQTFYDQNGNVVPQFTDTGTTHATRISVQ